MSYAADRNGLPAPGVPCHDPMQGGFPYARHAPSMDSNPDAALRRLLSDRARIIQTYPQGSPRLDQELNAIEMKIDQLQSYSQVNSLPVSGYHSVAEPADDFAALASTFEDEFRRDSTLGHSSGMPMQPVMYNGIPERMIGGMAPAIQQSTPMQRLKDSVGSLFQTGVKIGHQDSREMATRALPDLINLLITNEQQYVAQAANIIFHLSKMEGSRLIMSQEQSLISPVLKSMAASQHTETVLKLAGALHYMVQKSHGLPTIHQCGGTPIICSMLSFPIEGVVIYAVQILYSLLLSIEEAKEQARVHNALQCLVGLLARTSQDRLLAIIMDCLYLLAQGDPQSKLIILSVQGPTAMVRVLQTKDYSKLLVTTTRVLKVLSVCNSNKPAIVEAGGMQALARHLQAANPRLKRNILLTMRNLSDAANQQSQLEFLQQSLVQLLSDNDITTVTCAVGILSNLTCNNHVNKMAVCQASGVEAVLRLATHYSSFSDHEEIVERCLCTLRHLTNGHESADVAAQTVCVHQGHNLLARYLTPNNWSLAKPAIGLLSNLAQCSANHPQICESESLSRAVHLFHVAQPHSEQVVDDVKMKEIVESALRLLDQLARFEANHRTLHQLNCGWILARSPVLQNGHMPAQPTVIPDFQQTSTPFGHAAPQQFITGWGVPDLSELDLATDLLNMPLTGAGAGEPMQELPADMADIFSLIPVD